MIRKLIFAAAVMMWLISDAEYTDSYYAAMDGKKKESLKTAAKSCVQNHTRLNYTNLPYQWQYTDVYPELVDGCKRWWEMYSNEVFLIKPGQDARSSFSANQMQREHSIPKSWWKKNGDVEYTPAYTDLWNLYPSDGPANQRKSNYPFGIVSKATYDNGSCKVGGAATGYGGGSATVFEPADEYKGDFARTIFYMATVYDDLPWVYSYMFATETWPTLRPWAYEMLLEWSRMDPVSQKELVRNDAVEESQGNRNPFIDFPELAEYIWGTRTSETFIISEQGGHVTPPITGEPELTLPISGSSLDFGEVAVGATKVGYLEFVGKNFKDPISLRISGTDKSMFTLSENSILPSVINSGEKYLLPITFSPSSTGEKEAGIIIYDGGLSGSISVTLIGRGAETPVLSKLTALDATDITASGYTANWTQAPETVDFYVVNRLRYLEDGVVSETIESPQNRLEVTGRSPEVMESYTVQSSRLGYLSEPSNSIIVAPSTADAIEIEPLVIGSLEGGFGIISNPGLLPLKVYDMEGRLVRVRERPEAGEFIDLPGGIFVVTSPSLHRPVKIIVY